MSNFTYCAKQVNKLIDDNGYKMVAMKGVYNDLIKLKPVIENVFDDHVFFLDFWRADCGYHGWDWSKDDGTMANMSKITTGITDKFLEIYAMILGGLGERCEKEDKE